VLTTAVGEALTLPVPVLSTDAGTVPAAVADSVPAADEDTVPAPLTLELLERLAVSDGDSLTVTEAVPVADADSPRECEDEAVGRADTVVVALTEADPEAVLDTEPVPEAVIEGDTDGCWLPVELGGASGGVGVWVGAATLPRTTMP